MVAPAVLRRCHTDDFGEARTERAEGRASYGGAGIGDRPSLPQKSLGTLDASCHQVAVGSFAIRRTELAREVSRRHERSPSHGRDIERLRVGTVYVIARPA
jgi:hypothetical protein